MKKEIRIPTLLGLILLVIGLGSAIFLIENFGALYSEAAASTIPQEITVVNVTDTGFSVSWMTQAPTTGALIYKNRVILEQTRTATDVRDKNSLPQLRFTHFITISGLKPNTSYEVTLISGNNQYPDLAPTVSTLTPLPPPSLVSDPVFGTLVDAYNNPVPEALVYVSFDGSQTLSALVDNAGNWMIPLSLLRSQEGNRYYEPSKKEQEHLFFVNKDGRSTVTTTIENDSPVPTIRLGESYDFTRATSKKNRGLIIAQAQPFLGNSGTANTPFQVTYPTKGAGIPSDKPAFKGTGAPGKLVHITLSASKKLITADTTISTNGLWSWTPTEALAAGKYTAIVTSYTAKNAPVATSVSFIVLKSGTSVLGDATPSASLTPSPTATASPITSASPSASLSPSPTASASIPPVTGTSGPTYSLFMLGLLFISFGTWNFLRQKHY